MFPSYFNTEAKLVISINNADNPYDLTFFLHILFLFNWFSWKDYDSVYFTWMYRVLPSWTSWNMFFILNEDSCTRSTARIFSTGIPQRVCPPEEMNRLVQSPSNTSWLSLVHNWDVRGGQIIVHLTCYICDNNTKLNFISICQYAWAALGHILSIPIHKPQALFFIKAQEWMFICAYQKQEITNTVCKSTLKANTNWNFASFSVW